MSLVDHFEKVESGIDWLGEVPVDWDVMRLRHVAELNPSKSEVAEVDREQHVSFLPMEAIGDDGTIDLEKSRPIGAVENGYTYFRDGDVTLAKITPCFENGKGAIMRDLLNGIGFGTTELIVARPRPDRITSEYLNWLFGSTYFRKLGEGSMYGAGGQKRVPDDFVRNFEIAIPPLDEQKAISSFLDVETSKIDGLVSEQRRLIELLKEKRQAVISHAVTKGLNPNAPLAKSGQSWVSEFPAHWSLKPNKSLFRIRKELVGERHHEYQLLSLTKRGVIVRDMSTGDGKHSDYLERAQEVRPGDLVFCLFDVEETPRTVGLSDHLGMISGDYTVFECADSSTARFLEYFYIAMDDRKRLGSLYTGLRKRIHKRRFLAVKTPMPPPDEQASIVDHIAEQVEKLTRLEAEAERAIELLQERRTALISAAVTGKIDVRNFADQETA